MPIQPIDLQVLFSRMLDVGREQAIQNELVNVAQSLQASELVKQTEAQSTNVNETRQTDEVEHAHGGGGGGPKPEVTAHGGRKRTAKKPAFEDPELGKNVDISG